MPFANALRAVFAPVIFVRIRDRGGGRKQLALNSSGKFRTILRTTHT